MKENSNIENTKDDQTTAIAKSVRRRRRRIIASKRNYDWYGKAKAKLRSSKMMRRRHARQVIDIQKCFRCELPMRWHSEHLIDGSQRRKPVQVFECTNCGQLSAHAGKRAW